jgi:hypothetical protein
MVELAAASFTAVAVRVAAAGSSPTHELRL